ncbi:MAG: nucleotide sugar dehydrogenase [Rhodothermales bacterium]|nr:nucleotide sugar dehydrogenase [Rhodothermales bacterium]
MHLPLSSDLALDEAPRLPHPEPLRALQEKIRDRTAVIGVAGLGYVGLPLAMAYAHQGFPTLGIDLDAARVDRLQAGLSYIQDVETKAVHEAVRAGRFTATEDYASIGTADVVFICVPTPVTQHKDPDTRYIEAAARSIAAQLREGQLIVLKSTTFPNTTEELVQPILAEAAAARGLELGRDYFLAFSPERVDPGNQTFTTENTPVVVGGVTAGCTEVAALTLEQIIAHVHRVSSPRVAEMGKLLENIFRSVNIALVNELAKLCDRMGDVSIWEVVGAAATKPFGFMPFYPGPGLGGHCIPIDPYYLSWLARKYDFETSFITLAARINEEMPFYVSDAVHRAIAAQPVSTQDAKVLLLGVAFKRDVDDTRHAPALKVIEILRRQGVQNVAYSDPHVPHLTLRLPTETLELDSVALSAEVLREQDVIVIVTDHSDFPYAGIAEHARAIVDTRNALKDIPGENIHRI